MYANPRLLPKNLGNPLLLKVSINKKAHPWDRYAYFTLNSYLLLWLTWLLEFLQVTSSILSWDSTLPPIIVMCNDLKSPNLSSESFFSRNRCCTSEHWRRLWELLSCCILINNYVYSPLTRSCGGPQPGEWNTTTTTRTSRWSYCIGICIWHQKSTLCYCAFYGTAKECLSIQSGTSSLRLNLLWRDCFNDEVSQRA